jgi:hypothetical protein
MFLVLKAHKELYRLLGFVNYQQLNMTGKIFDCWEHIRSCPLGTRWYKCCLEVCILYEQWVNMTGREGQTCPTIDLRVIYNKDRDDWGKIIDGYWSFKCTYIEAFDLSVHFNTLGHCLLVSGILFIGRTTRRLVVQNFWVLSSSPSSRHLKNSFAQL